MRCKLCKLRIYYNKLRSWLFHKHLDVYFDSCGIWFFYYGDTVCLRWPWKDGNKYISLMATSNGDFGTAEFDSLESIRSFWYDLRTL